MKELKIVRASDKGGKFKKHNDSNKEECDRTCEQSAHPEGNYNMILERCGNGIIGIMRRNLGETPTMQLKEHCND